MWRSQRSFTLERSGRQRVRAAPLGHMPLGIAVMQKYAYKALALVPSVDHAEM